MQSQPLHTQSSDSISISVIVPSLNQGRYIERTIRSVIEQDYPNKEFGGLDENLRFSMDFEYWLQIGKKKEMVFIDRPLANYQLH